MSAGWSGGRDGSYRDTAGGAKPGMGQGGGRGRAGINRRRRRPMMRRPHMRMPMRPRRPQIGGFGGGHSQNICRTVTMLMQQNPQAAQRIMAMLAQQGIHCGGIGSHGGGMGMMRRRRMSMRPRRTFGKSRSGGSGGTAHGGCGGKGRMGYGGRDDADEKRGGMNVSP